MDSAGTSFSAPLGAGAAAVLKAARPGLTQQQYRSLLINTATAATVDAATAAGVQQAGAGVLNLEAALAGTIAAYPTALNFGSRAGAFSSTLNLTLSEYRDCRRHVLGRRRTRGIRAGSGPVERDIVPGREWRAADRRDSNASNLAPGEYQGYLRVSGASRRHCGDGFQYWFAVPARNRAASRSCTRSMPWRAVRRCRGRSCFASPMWRACRTRGLSAPSVRVANSGGDAHNRNYYVAGDIPGTYGLDVRTGSSRCRWRYCGRLTRTVTIGVY